MTTATALAAALAAAPAMATSSSTAVASGASPTAVASTRVVTLVTGDRVVLSTDSTGHSTASLTLHSPHYGKPLEYVNTPAHTWVVPKLPISVRRHLDPSVFDVSALSGKVALKVTFDAGAAPRSLPGIDVQTSSARRVSGGRTTVSASYDANRPLPSRLSRSLRGVSIAVQGAAQQAPAGYALQTLTINGTTAKGKPLPYADTFVMNTDDGRLAGFFGGIIHGQWKVAVPSGHYVVLSTDFSRAVVSQVDVADTDASVDFSMGDASVQPRMVLPDHKSISPALDLIGTDARGKSSFDFGWSGMMPKVNPLPHLATGTLNTEIANLWAPKGYREWTFDNNHVTVHPLTAVAAAKEVLPGIPKHLTFTYTNSDFAHVSIEHYATGPKDGALDGFFGFSPQDQFAFIELFPTVRPGVVQAMYQGSKNIRWDSLTTVNRSFRNFSQLEQASTYHRGQRAEVPFFRGPVTPVADRGGESGHTGFACQLCVKNGNLMGFMSLASSAGTTQFGYFGQGTWDLVSRRSRLDRGRYAITPFVKNVKPGQELRLYANTQPGDTKYQLSSHVADWWQFKVPSKDQVVPILRAAYTPPTTLNSVGNTGRESFPITFDNLGPLHTRVVSASVKWSVDGKKWHAASLTRRDGNTFRASYTNPVATRVHRTLSLRIAARDAAGRRMSEQVKSAYYLPKAGARTVPRTSSAGATSTRTAGRMSSATVTSTQSTGHLNRFVPSKLCRTTTDSQYACFVKLNAATKTAGRAMPDPAGWGAPALREAYGLGADPAPSTVAVIVAYDYPHAEADMNQYRRQFGLPACTSASGCFTKLNQKGEEGNYPAQDYGWGVEASLDLQMISTACPTCHIVLVEANVPTDKSLGRSEQAAVNAGATVTNHSFGRIELTGTRVQAALYTHPGVTAVASTGDFGYGPASFPASAPSVVAAGGTTLARSTTNTRGWKEKAWRWGGSGCSAYFTKVTGQTDTACHMRTASDVSAVARGLAIYNTSLPQAYRGWLEVDGTSASSPLIAGMIGSDGKGGLRPADLYAGPADAFNDVTSGANGFCKGSYMCTAVPGYDGPTGLGTPNGVVSFGLPPS
ncbi:MAG: hypothetical protein J2P22_11270 [Nocardioides sp.]|nr:hypothetical protein [Nocardioides sp.]